MFHVRCIQGLSQKRTYPRIIHIPIQPGIFHIFFISRDILYIPIHRGIFHIFFIYSIYTLTSRDIPYVPIYSVFLFNIVYIQYLILHTWLVYACSFFKLLIAMVSSLKTITLFDKEKITIVIFKLEAITNPMFTIQHINTHSLTTHERCRLSSSHKSKHINQKLVKIAPHTNNNITPPQQQRFSQNDSNAWSKERKNTTKARLLPHSVQCNVLLNTTPHSAV